MCMSTVRKNEGARRQNLTEENAVGERAPDHALNNRFLRRWRTGLFSFSAWRIAGSLLLIFLTLTAGCSGGVNRGTSGQGGLATQEEAVSKPLPSSVVNESRGNPYTVTDDTGRKVTLLEKPLRIVSLTYGTDEILHALAGSERIVAYSRHAGDPEISFLSRSQVAKVGRRAQENAEAIYGLQPDLVVVSTATPPDLVSALEQMGVAVYIAASPKNVAQVKQKVRGLGRAVGEEAKTKLLLDEMDQRLTALEKRLSAITGNRRKTAVAFTMSGPMGRKGELFDSILQAAHVINGGASDHPLGIKGQISKEQVVEVNPDIFILPTWNYDSNQDTRKFNREIAEDPAFRNLQAVQTGRMVPVSDRYRYVASHHVVDAIANIAYAVYPEVFPEGRPKDWE